MKIKYLQHSNEWKMKNSWWFKIFNRNQQWLNILKTLISSNQLLKWSIHRLRIHFKSVLSNRKSSSLLWGKSKKFKIEKRKKVCLSLSTSKFIWLQSIFKTKWWKIFHFSKRFFKITKMVLFLFKRSTTLGRYSVTWVNLRSNGMKKH